MPEFILDYGSPAGALAYSRLDEFTQGYIEAMFFTDANDPDDGDLQHATFADLSDEALARIKQDCERFQTANADDLGEATDNGRINGYDLKAAGRDYWYTRNGHGVGFWDRGLGNVGDKLSEAARYSAVDLYLGSDGKVYLS